MRRCHMLLIHPAARGTPPCIRPMPGVSAGGGSARRALEMRVSNLRCADLGGGGGRRLDTPADLL